MRLHRLSLPLILTACAPSVTVTPTKDAPTVPSKPENCEIEFFEMDVLQRPYDALAEIRVIPATGSLGGPESRRLRREEMRRQACLLGADAVIGVHKAVGQYTDDTLVGTAVRYRR